MTRIKTPKIIYDFASAELTEKQTLITPELVVAIAKVESNWNIWAIRYEKNYKYLYYPRKVKPPDCSIETEIIAQKTSWGLCQIMGAVAREYGFEGWLTHLLEPYQNIKYAIRHLLTLEKRYKRFGLSGIISAYNAGSPRMVNGRYINQDYVNKVYRALQEVKQDGTENKFRKA